MAKLSLPIWLSSQLAAKTATEAPTRPECEPHRTRRPDRMLRTFLGPPYIL